MRKVRLQGCNASLVRGKGGILVRLVDDYRLLLLNGWIKNAALGHKDKTMKKGHLLCKHVFN